MCAEYDIKKYYVFSPKFCYEYEWSSIFVFSKLINLKTLHFFSTFHLQTVIVDNYQDFNYKTVTLNWIEKIIYLHHCYPKLVTHIFVKTKKKRFSGLLEMQVKTCNMSVYYSTIRMLGLTH